MEKDFTGKTVQEAIEKACLQFNLAPENLDYEIIQEEGKKIFGLLGGRKAIIRVRYEEKEGREIVKDLIDSAFKEHLLGEAGENRTSVGISGGQELAEDADQLEKPEKVGEKDELKSAEKKNNQVVRKKTSLLSTIDLDGVEKTVVKILDLMGVEVKSLKLHFEGQDCQVIIEEGAESPILTWRKGQVLDALQYLVNKLHGVRGGRIYVDSGGYRSRHENNIRRLALKLGAKAKKSRRPVTINALNAHDRRLVHLVIQEDKDLRSRSKGEGEFKKIIIYPKNSIRRREKNKTEVSSN